jgi:hypothetical protein
MISKELSDFVASNDQDFEIHYFNEKKPYILCLGSGHEFTNPTVAQLEAHRQSKRVKLKVLRAAVDYSQYEPYIVPTRNSHQLWCKLTKQYINKIPHEIEAHLKGRRYQVALARGQVKSSGEGEGSDSEDSASDASNEFSAASDENNDNDASEESSDGLAGSGEEIEGDSESSSDSSESDENQQQVQNQSNQEEKMRKDEPSPKKRASEPIELSKNDIFSIVHRPYKGQVNVNDLVVLAAKKESKQDASKKLEYARKKVGAEESEDEKDSEDGNETPFDRTRQRIFMGSNVEDNDGEFEVVPEAEIGALKIDLSDDDEKATTLKQPTKSKSWKKKNNKNKNSSKPKHNANADQKSNNANKNKSSNNSHPNQKRKFHSKSNNNNNDASGSKKPKF